MGGDAVSQPPTCRTLAILRAPRLGEAIVLTTMAEMMASKAIPIIRDRSRNCRGRMVGPQEIELSSVTIWSIRQEGLQLGFPNWLFFSNL
jgi:hypothetical protein